MQDMSLEFVLSSSMDVHLKKGEHEAFVCRFDNGELVCAIAFDFHEQPLVLRAAAKEGDRVTLNICAHRLELLLNGILCDEEWPAGQCLAEMSDVLCADAGMTVKPYTQPKEDEPSVLGVFTDAEGWRPSTNVFVGDCMPYVNDGRYHVLYLKDRRHHKSKWGRGAHQWEHISTADFKQWQIHPTAIAITDPLEGSICTGSWIGKDQTEFLFYTVRMMDGSPAPICRCVSSDGYHFEKDRHFSFVLSERYEAAVARDPKVVQDESGLYHMLLTTRLVAERKGCLAHLVSQDLDTWEEREPLLITEDANEPECADHICYNGLYYLIYSLNSQAYYRFSEHPFASDWTIPEDPRIPCSSVPKGAVWNGELVFTGYRSLDGGYAGSMTFCRAVSDAKGQLLFAR